MYSVNTIHIYLHILNPFIVEELLDHKNYDKNDLKAFHRLADGQSRTYYYLLERKANKYKYID